MRNYEFAKCSNEPAEFHYSKNQTKESNKLRTSTSFFLQKKSSVTHIRRVFVKTMHQSRQIFVELKNLPYLKNRFQQDANV
jgi:hypothetical protein